MNLHGIQFFSMYALKKANYLFPYVSHVKILLDRAKDGCQSLIKFIIN